jgi:hemerythrin-like domain-containing protein
MIEHRLIKQIIKALETELYHISHDKIAHPIFIYNAVDFFRIYADQFHHGKEEDILFVELSKKNLDSVHQRIMKELEDEHSFARLTVGKLVTATSEWVDGEEKALSTVSECLKKLCELYTKHIKKEEKDFFFSCQQYFTEEERIRLLEAGYQFDQNFTNTVYKDRMKSLLSHGARTRKCASNTINIE